ncbi:MAG: hypothetical protein ACLFR6_03210 [Salinarchaeum sp.]
MSEAVVLVVPSETPTPGIKRTLDHLDRQPVETLVHDRPEDGRYYLSPATVERVETVLDETAASLVIVDGETHPGQAVDLEERLNVETRDRRSLVWEHLAEVNPVAETRLALRRRRIDRRAAANRQRQQSIHAPTGTSGRLDDLTRRCQELQQELTKRQRVAQDRIRTAHTDVDAHVLTIRQANAEAATEWTALTGKSADSGLRPRRPQTTMTTVQAHTIAVTTTPDIPGDRGLPEWVTAAVPGIEPAIDRADVVVGTPGAFLNRITDSDTPAVVTDETASIPAAVAERLPTVQLVIELPYADNAHTLVSWLHDNTVVRETTYTDAITVHCTVPEGARDEIVRRVESVGGTWHHTAASVR